MSAIIIEEGREIFDKINVTNCHHSIVFKWDINQFPYRFQMKLLSFSWACMCKTTNDSFKKGTYFDKSLRCLLRYLYSINYSSYLSNKVAFSFLNQCRTFPYFLGRAKKQINKISSTTLNNIININGHHSVFSYFYSVTVPGYQGNLQAAVTHSASLAAWERFGVELILTFIIVLTYFVATNGQNKIFGYPSLVIGAAYSACSFVSVSWHDMTTLIVTLAPVSLRIL